MPSLHLVRHARPLVDPTTPAHTWPLDPTCLDDLEQLARSGRLPSDAAWYTSPEPKAVATARGLTEGAVTTVEALAEHSRGPHWFDDPAAFREAVRRAFAEPDERAVPAWEPLSVTRARVVPAVRRIVARHPDRDVVLVGHGTAWTVLVSELAGEPPDLDAWAALRMPDVWVVDCG